MSEFERAVFRVYENTIDGLNFDGTHTNFSTKLIRFMEVFFRFAAVFSFLALIFLHGRFVGDNKLNCLPALLAAQKNNTSALLPVLDLSPKVNNTNVTNTEAIEERQVFFNFTDDYILHLNVYISQDELDNMNLVKLNSSSDTTTNKDQYRLQRKKPDFSYASTSAVLSLKSELQKKFEIVNITLPHQECFGEYPLFGGSIYGLVAYFDGVGTVLMNDLMYASRKSGVLLKYTGSRASWTADDLHVDDNKTPHKQDMRERIMTTLIATNDIMWYKMGILFNSCLAFFLLSTSTAMLIRILLSSGVIILYPILLALEVTFH